MIKAVIFDLDNTLLDFVKMKQQAVKAALRAMVEAGLDLDLKESFEDIFQIYRDLGWEHQQVFDLFLKAKTGEVNNKYLAAAVVAYRRNREARLITYPNVNRTLIQLLKMSIKLAVVSDAPGREAWLRIYYLNLHHFFDQVVTHDDTGARKPSPKPFQLAMEKLDVQPDEVLMVGDWPERDMVGAQQLGIKSIYARYGDFFGPSADSGADWDVNDIYELIGIIHDING